MSWDKVGYLAWLRSNAAVVLDALGITPGGGTAEPFREISSLPAEIDPDDQILLVTASGTLNLPSPAAQTSGRKLVFKATASVVLAPSAGDIEQETEGYGPTLSLSSGDSVCLRAAGTHWMIFAG